jgi:hypothetical protein
VSRRAGLAALLLCVVAASGCAHYPVNAQLAAPSGKGGYRFPRWWPTAPIRPTSSFVCLSFSGGGTRAAAFLARPRSSACGDIDIGRAARRAACSTRWIASRASRAGRSPPPITGCSGKAGLDTFYDRFLKRNIKAELALRVANPGEPRAPGLALLQPDRPAAEL